MPTKKPDLTEVAAQVDVLQARVDALSAICLDLAKAVVGGYSRMPPDLVKALQDWLKN